QKRLRKQRGVLRQRFRALFMWRQRSLTFCRIFMSKRDNLLKLRQSIDRSLCENDGCHLNYGKGNPFAWLLKRVVRFVTRNRWRSNFGAALRVKTLEQIVRVLHSREYLEEVSEEYDWIYLDNLYKARTGVRYSVKSLLGHPHFWLGYELKSGTPLLLSD